HRRDDRLAHAALAKLGELCGRQVELDRRLLDAADDRALGESGLDQFDDRVVRERRRAFELRLRVAAALGGRADDADGGAAGGLRVVVRAAAPAARAHAALRAARRAEDVRAARLRAGALRLRAAAAPLAARAAVVEGQVVAPV